MRSARIAGAYHLIPWSRNYLLAQAHVDASTLGTSIANLNTSTIFQPLQPLSDTDVTGFLKHAHEQTILSSIEEGRRDTQAEFYRVLEERVRRDWDNRKKRILDQFGVRGISASETGAGSALQLRQSVRGLASSVRAILVFRMWRVLTSVCSAPCISRPTSKCAQK